MLNDKYEEATHDMTSFVTLLYQEELSKNDMSPPERWSNVDYLQ